MPGSTDMEAIDIIWCSNPLLPAGSREVRRVVLTGTDTVDSLVKRLGLQPTPVVATLNGAPVPARRWRKKRVRATDVLVLQQQARGVEASTVAAGLTMKGGMAWSTAIAIGTVVAFAANIAISLAISALIGSLSRKSSSQQAGGGYSPAAYGVEGGSNGFRPYEPLPLVLGEHRLFPDYASRPFAEFVPDPSTATEVINNSPQTAAVAPSHFELDDQEPPKPNAPWVVISEEFDPTDPTKLVRGTYGDGITRTYARPMANTPPWWPSDNTAPHTFLLEYRGTFAGVPSLWVISWEDFTEANASGTTPIWSAYGPLNIIQRYGYTLIYNTERLTSIFNVGFGALDISEVRIGANALSQYNAVETHSSFVPGGQGDRTRLEGYTSVDWPGNAYPGNVQVVDGGKLELRPLVPNNGWIERAASQGCRYIQIDIAGRLFLQANGGVYTALCGIEAEYMAEGSSSWVPMPWSPTVIGSGSTTPVRQTYSAMLPVPAAKVRVRRSTPEPTDAAIISELEFTRAKFMRDSDGLYPAQRRLGVMIKASGQLNGRIERLSLFAQARHWRWTGGAWTPGAFPGGAGWEWGHTVNPAWLFLYYARGGFLNTTAAPAHLGLAGWLDEPAPGNGPRLFGAGLENARIDYASIVAWAQYCDAAGLQCRMVVNGTRSAGDVLDDIAAAGRATKTWATGKLGVVWEAAGQPVVAAFGMSNIVAGSFKIAYLSDDPIDEYELAFTRADADYEADTVRAVVPGVPLPVNRRSDQAVYSMTRSQAQRLVNLLAASRAYHRRTIRFETNALGATVQRGDIVHLAHDLTRWAYSGRLVGLKLQAGQVREVELSAEVENPTGDATVYLQVQPPGGEPFVVACQAPAARSRVLQVTGVWPAASAPGWIDAAAQNVASGYPGTIPEDWTYLAGPTATPGKRCRVIAMEPSNARRLRITLRDEYEAYYPLEWGLGAVPPAPSGERLVARAVNAAIEPAAAGGYRLSWELFAAHGADVFVSVNGAPGQQVPIQGHLTVAGREILLPAYPPGTNLYIEVRPVAAAAPVATEWSTLSMVT